MYFSVPVVKCCQQSSPHCKWLYISPPPHTAPPPPLILLLLVTLLLFLPLYCLFSSFYCCSSSPYTASPPSTDPSTLILLLLLLFFLLLLLLLQFTWDRMCDSRVDSIRLAPSRYSFAKREARKDFWEGSKKRATQKARESTGYVFGTR